MQLETFQTISLDQLVTATGGQQQGISTADVLEAGGKATTAVLSRGASLLPNLGQAYRQFNDPRVGNTFIDRAAYGFTGLFGIDPLKK
jgi:hypothetical protein